MSNRKSYEQFCGLARSLDRIGDRWTLLIVRELLIGDAAYRELAAALPGVSPGLLSARLSQLVTDGIVERTNAPRRSKAVRYRLSDIGKELAPAIADLIRWGTRWMLAGPATDHVDPRWGVLALSALLDDPSMTSPPGTLQVVIEATELYVTIGPEGRIVSAPPPPTHDATRACARPDLLAVASGTAPLEHLAHDTPVPRFAAAALRPSDSDN